VTGEAAAISRARRLAGRLNLLPIALFGLWSVPAKAFWLIALGLIAWPQPVPPADAVLPWFFCSFLAGPWVLLLPRGFHEPWEWERKGQFYRRIGVEHFRAIVANGDLVNRFVRARHRNYHVYGPEIERLVPKSIWNEKRHIAYLCWGFVTAYYAHVIGWDRWATWLAGANIGANLYPAMLQRYSRARVLRLARLGQRREGLIARAINAAGRPLGT
jgi:Glycosyl-4,4'-diaponeurosporenoate acyltransferase